MTNSQKIFTDTTILKTLKLWLNDQELFAEDILSLEIKWSFTNFYVSGTLTIKDSFGMAELNMFDGKTELKIYSKDLYDETFEKTFIITGIRQEDYNERYKAYNLAFFDKVYFNLATAFISKSFNDTPGNALQTFFPELGIDSIMETDNLTLDIGSDGTAEGFAVPQSESVYEFFIKQMRRQGFRWWQDRKQIHAKKIDLKDLPVANNGKEDVVFSNNTDNMLYGFKIYDFKVSYNDTLSRSVISPFQSTVAFDPLTKSSGGGTVNLVDVYPTMQLNDMQVGTDLTVQHTYGAKQITSELLTADEQKLEIEDVYMNNTVIEAVVPGNFKFNYPGQIVNVEFKGNPLITKSSLQGDTFHSGKYILREVSDRFIGDKLIQKVTLVRPDLTKPRAG